MRYTILATFAALLAYVWFFIKVGKARKEFGIEAPRTSGNINFERVFRVQQNTIEHLVIFLPGLFIFGFYVSDDFGGLLGLAWTGARCIHAAESYANAKRRGIGTALTALIELVLLIGGTIGAMLQAT